MTKICKSKQKKICQDYIKSKMSLMTISKKYNIGNRLIAKCLKSNGLKVRSRVEAGKKYSFDETFFEEINTPEKAYFLGLLYADGCNHFKTNCVNIGLQKKDKAILMRLKKEMKANLKFCVRKLSLKNPNHQDSYRLFFTSKKLCDDLNKLGCVPNKSLILKFPTEEQVPKHLLRFFVAGYFDGDGWVGYRVRGKNEFIILWSITSTIYFLEGLHNFLKEQGVNTHIKKIGRLAKKGNYITQTLESNSNTSSLKFFELIYSNSSIFLKRKYKKFLKFKTKLEKAREKRNNATST